MPQDTLQPPVTITPAQLRQYADKTLELIDQFNSSNNGLLKALIAVEIAMYAAPVVYAYRQLREAADGEPMRSLQI